MSYKTPITPPEQICWQVLNNEVDLVEGARTLIQALTDLDESLWETCDFYEVYPDAEVVETMLRELQQHPKKQKEIIAQHQEGALRAFEQLLDNLTAPFVLPDRERSIIHSIPRSSPQEELLRQQEQEKR